MANVVTRRLLNRSLFKLKSPICVATQNRCMSVLIVDLHHHEKFRQKPLLPLTSHNHHVRFYSEKEQCQPTKPSIFQRFKQMYKDYWYVLVPVHLVTSAAWFGGFYYMAKSGVDIVGILESLKVSEKIINPLKDSSMGYLAVAYALYKVATPARYTVTLGGTTISISYLQKWGYIKPVPSTERIKELVLEKKDNFMESMRETQEGLKVKSEKLKDKKENIINDLDQSIRQIKELGDKMKSNKQHCVEEVKKKPKETKD